MGAKKRTRNARRRQTTSTSQPQSDFPTAEVILQPAAPLLLANGRTLRADALLPGGAVTGYPTMKLPEADGITLRADTLFPRGAVTGYSSMRLPEVDGMTVRADAMFPAGGPTDYSTKRPPEANGIKLRADGMLAGGGVTDYATMRLPETNGITARVDGILRRGAVTDYSTMRLPEANGITVRVDGVAAAARLLGEVSFGEGWGGAVAGLASSASVFRSSVQTFADTAQALGSSPQLHRDSVFGSWVSSVREASAVAFPSVDAKLRGLGHLSSEFSPAYFVSTRGFVDSAAAMTSAIVSYSAVPVFAHTAVEPLTNDLSLHADPSSAYGALSTADYRVAVEGVARRLVTALPSYEGLLSTSLATARLSATLNTVDIAPRAPTIRDLCGTLNAMSLLSRDVYTEFSHDTPLVVRPDSWLFKSPTVEQYAGACAVAVVAGVDDEVLDQVRDGPTDALLSDVGARLEDLLGELDPELVEMYRGGAAAIQWRGSDWTRQAAVSVRSLLHHLLRRLAPDREVTAFLRDPTAHRIRGEYSRKARLRYIFRDVSSGAYAGMAEQDMELLEATYNAMNEMVHAPARRLTTRQAHLLWIRVQSHLAMLFAATEH